MLLKKLSLVLVCMISMHFAFGQDFQRGSIRMSDGKTKTGFVKVPKYSAVNEISYKETVDSKKETIDRDLIQSVSITSKSGNTYVFENRQVSLRENKISSRKALLLKIADGYASVYFAGNQYDTDKNGDVITEYEFIQSKDLPTFNYYIRKKGDEYVSFLAMTSTSPTMFGLNKTLKKNAARLLFEDKELVSKITNDEYTHENIREIMTVYNEFMEGR